MKGIQLTGYGNPADVVKLVDVPSVGTPEAHEIVIDIEAVPIEPSDLYMVAGIYGNLPKLPHFLGIEGVGRVSAVGRSVKYLKEGDRVITPPFVPSMVERVKTSATWMRPLPDADVNQLALLGCNPATAYLLLTEFVKLKAGDWIICNAANSSVGRSIIPLAKAWGIKTVNVVRRPELVEEMKKLGGDLVLVDGPDLPKQVAEATGESPIALALDGVGDVATQNLLDCLPLYGTLLVYSGMSGKPAQISNPKIIFQGQSIHAFWIFNWFRNPDLGKAATMYDELPKMVASGALSLPVAKEFSFSEHQEAFALASQYNGKALLKPNIQG